MKKRHFTLCNSGWVNWGFRHSQTLRREVHQKRCPMPQRETKHRKGPSATWKRMPEVHSWQTMWVIPNVHFKRVAFFWGNSDTTTAIGLCFERQGFLMHKCQFFHGLRNRGFKTLDLFSCQASVSHLRISECHLTPYGLLKRFLNWDRVFHHLAQKCVPNDLSELLAQWWQTLV